MCYKLFFLLYLGVVIQTAVPQSSRKHQFRGRKNAVDCLYNICEHAPDYPENIVRKIIQKNPDLNSYFGNIIEPSDPFVLQDRFLEPDYKPFCNTVDLTVLPQFMTDVDNEQRAIANVDGYRQVVKYQTCDFSQGEQCFAGSLLERKTKCVQKFHVIKLLTVNMSNNTLEYRDFQVPTTCVCTYVME